MSLSKHAKSVDEFLAEWKSMEEDLKFKEGDKRKELHHSGLRIIFELSENPSQHNKIMNKMREICRRLDDVAARMKDL